MASAKDRCTTCRARVCDYSKDECVCPRCYEYKCKLIQAGCYDSQSIKNYNLYGS